MRMARCHSCSRFYRDPDPRRKFGTCDDCTAEILAERAIEEELERKHEEEQTAPGVVLMNDWNEADIPF